MTFHKFIPAALSLLLMVSGCKNDTGVSYSLQRFYSAVTNAYEPQDILDWADGVFSNRVEAGILERAKLPEFFLEERPHFSRPGYVMVLTNMNGDAAAIVVEFGGGHAYRGIKIMRKGEIPYPTTEERIDWVPQISVYLRP